MKLKIIETKNSIKKHETKINEYLDKLDSDMELTSNKILHFEDDIYYTTFLYHQ